MNTDAPKIAPPSDATWYVVATKSRNEGVAKLNLERQGYRSFLPTMNLKKRRRGQWTLVKEPLFPGYLFVSLVLGTDDPAPIRSTAGCVGLVRFGHTYTPVPAELVAGMEAAATTDDPALAPFQSGDAVRLMSGPFAGLEAVYDMAKGEDRAGVLLEALGRACTCFSSVQASSVAVVGKSTPAFGKLRLHAKCVALPPTLFMLLLKKRKQYPYV